MHLWHLFTDTKMHVYIWKSAGYDMYFCIAATKERSIIFRFSFTKEFFLKVSKRMPNVMFQQDMYLHIFVIIVSLISYFTT